MKKVRVGIIGLGNMGTRHASQLAAGAVNGAELAAVCDPNAEKLAWAQNIMGAGGQCFSSVQAFFDKADIDGVLIATPHASHPGLAMEAFRSGFHVLSEKPAGVMTQNVRMMNEAARASGKVFGMMFNQRTDPLYQKVRGIIADGELGEIKRTNWTITNWYRPQSYYDSSSWRATWAGEGGGILLNQAVHQLDLWLWVTGMLPSKIHSFCRFGKHRDIEVEDEATVYAEYENGATGLFIASVAEAPGTNRLEIAGDRGKIVVENGKLQFWQLRQSEADFNRTNQKAFGQPEHWQIEVPVPAELPAHEKVIENWAAAILTGEPLLAPGEEGINSLEVVNAAYLSTWLGRAIELPVDEKLYADLLQERISASVK